MDKTTNGMFGISIARICGTNEWVAKRRISRYVAIAIVLKRWKAGEG